MSIVYCLIIKSIKFHLRRIKKVINKCIYYVSLSFRYWQILQNFLEIFDKKINKTLR